jgi:outer membrane protein OmpA-like peptidoglycan-associated protein
VQNAEDARAIAVKRQNEDLLASERSAAADRELRAENGRTAAQAEAERIKRDTEAQRVAAKTEADRLKVENDAKMLATQGELDRAAQSTAKAEAEKKELRATLLLQFNAILQTRDTPRGLVVNLSDVLFDSAKFSLRPEAREKLARVAGVVSGHPGLRLDVEGHTDNIGSDTYNQQLSEERGSAVRDYLAAQGMKQDSLTTRGFGKTQPVASNDNASGRQQNRRVELVISGELIGTVLGSPIALK